MATAAATSRPDPRRAAFFEWDVANNRALHMIAVVRLRYCDRTRAYAERRRDEGKTTKEILRCLKRYIARQVYRTLVADLYAQPT